VQALTGAKGKFKRTPKVRDRTVPAFVYVVLPYVLVAFSAYTFKVAWEGGLWANAAFAALNGVLAAYAIVAFVGLRDSLVDIWANVVSWLYKPQRPKPAPPRGAPLPAGPGADEEVGDWQLALYMGFADRRRTPRDAKLNDPTADDRIELRLPVAAPTIDDGAVTDLAEEAH
jgi:hypothetical protein